MSWSYYEKERNSFHPRNAENNCADNIIIEPTLKSLDLFDCPEFDLYGSTPTTYSRSKKRDRRKSKRKFKGKGFVKPLIYIDMQDSEAEVGAENKKTQTKLRIYDRKIKSDNNPLSPNNNNTTIPSTDISFSSEPSNNYYSDYSKSMLHRGGNDIHQSNTTIFTTKPFKCLESHPVTISAPVNTSVTEDQSTNNSPLFSQGFLAKIHSSSSTNSNSTSNKTGNASRSKEDNNTFGSPTSPLFQAHNFQHLGSKDTEKGAQKRRNERKEICQKFFMKLEMGKGREARGTQQCGRQLSCEEKLWRLKWADVLWLELQACINGVPASKQDVMLDLQRRCVPEVLQRVMTFKVHKSHQAASSSAAACSCDCNDSLPTTAPSSSSADLFLNSLSTPHSLPSVHPLNTSPPCQPLPPPSSSLSHSSSIPSSSHPSSMQPFLSNCNNVIGACLSKEIHTFTEAAIQVSDVINQIEWLQSLYPNDRALQRGCPEYLETKLQTRLTCLRLWFDTTLDLVQYIRYVYDLVTSAHVRIADRPKHFSLWWCVEQEELKRLLQVLKRRRPEHLQHLISQQSSRISNASSPKSGGFNNEFVVNSSSSNNNSNNNSNNHSNSNNLDILSCFSRFKKMSFNGTDEKKENGDDDDDDGGGNGRCGGGGEADRCCEDDDDDDGDDDDHGLMNGRMSVSLENKKRPQNEVSGCDVANKVIDTLLRNIPSRSSLPSLDSFEILPTSSTSFYRKFVDRSLKTSEVRDLCRRLRNLLERTLNRGRLVLDMLDGGADDGAIVSGDDSDAGRNDSEREKEEKGEAKFTVSSGGDGVRVLQGGPDDVYKYLKAEGREGGKVEEGGRKKVALEGRGGEESGERGGEESGERGGDLRACMRDMALPSFRSFFLFLAKVLLDVMHEGLKMRIAQQPKNNSSSESLKPLIKQCKEILRASVSTKRFYLRLTRNVQCGGHHEEEMQKFEESLMQMLKIYFDYMNQFTFYLQQVPRMSKQLKDFMGREWRFCKQVCCHIHNGEADAGNKFCSMTSSLLKYISDILSSGIDDCNNKLMRYEEGIDDDDDDVDEDDNDVEEDDYEEEGEEEAEGGDDDDASIKGLPRSKSNLFRRRLLQLGREVKGHFNEARDSSLRTLLFARMIKNDLEVVSEYKVVVPMQKLLQDLKITNHVEIITGQRLNYVIFAPERVANDYNLACHLLNVACCSDEHFDDGHTFPPCSKHDYSCNGCHGNSGGHANSSYDNNVGGHGKSFYRDNGRHVNIWNNDNYKINNDLNKSNNYNYIKSEGFYCKGGVSSRNEAVSCAANSNKNNQKNNKNIDNHYHDYPKRHHHHQDHPNDHHHHYEHPNDHFLHHFIENVKKVSANDNKSEGEREDEEEEEEGRKRIKSLSHDSDGEVSGRQSFEKIAFQSLNINSKTFMMRGNQYSNYLVFMSKNDLVSSSGEPLQWDGMQVRIDPNAEAIIALVHVEVENLLLVAVHSSKLHLCRRRLEECLRADVVLLDEQVSCHQSIFESLNELKSSAMDLQTSLSTGLAAISERFASLDVENIQMDACNSQKLLTANKDLVNYCFTFGFEYHKEVYRLISGPRRDDMSRRMVQFAIQWMNFAQTCSKGHGFKPRWACQGFDFIRFLMDSPNSDVIMRLSDQEFQEWKVVVSKCIYHVVGSRTPVAEFSPELQKSLCDRNQFTTHQNYSSPFPSRSATPTRSLSSNPILLSNSPFRPRRQAWRRAVECLDSGLDKARRDAKQIGQVTSRNVNSFSTDLKVRKVKFKWQRGNKIGEGQFGKVFSVVNLNSGELLAMKQMKLPLNDYKRMKKIEGEITILESVSHPSLVQFYGAEVFSDELLLFTEFCRNGTIEDLCKEQLGEASIRRYSHSILVAIYALHSHNIVHRDIKGANIFVMPNHSIKLGDFGCSVQLKAQETALGELNEWVGTPAFMAPEVINPVPDVGYGRSADIWSYGCVIIQMCTGKRPWPNLNKKEQIIFKVGLGEVPEIPERLSKETKEFLGHCLQSDPLKRWTVEQLLEHSFVKVDLDDENDP